MAIVQTISLQNFSSILLNTLQLPWWNSTIVKLIIHILSCFLFLVMKSSKITAYSFDRNTNNINGAATASTPNGYF